MSEPNVAATDATGSAVAATLATVLEVASVSAGYGELSVLRDVSFVVERGSILALLGPNGCGKTTLLRIIGKLHVASDGTISVVGRDIATMNQHELSRVMASVAQAQRTSFPFSVLDVLLTGRMPYISMLSSPSEADRALCREVLDWFGIGHLERKSVTKLSGGERQLVMIARALAQEPSVLLLDEPTAYLDLRNQVRVLETIRRLAHEQDLTVLMTIHDPNEALAYADRAVLLRKLAALEGIDPAAVEAAAERPAPARSVIATGTPADVLTPANVAEAYGVAVDVLEHAHRRLIVPAD
jgi:iron complex transport system ATP-binding protein